MSLLFKEKRMTKKRSDELTGDLLFSEVSGEIPQPKVSKVEQPHLKEADCGERDDYNLDDEDLLLCGVDRFEYFDHDLLLMVCGINESEQPAHGPLFDRTALTDQELLGEDRLWRVKKALGGRRTKVVFRSSQDEIREVEEKERISLLPYIPPEEQTHAEWLREYAQEEWAASRPTFVRIRRRY